MPFSEVYMVYVKKREINIVALVTVIFGFIGAIFIIGGICSIVYQKNFMEDAERVEALITDIQYRYDRDGHRSGDVYVSYEIDGEEYETKLGEYSSSMHKGQTINLYYDPEDPYEVMTGDVAKTIGIIFIIVGGVLFAVSMIIVFLSGRKKRKTKNLIETGEELWAEVAEVCVNNMITYRVSTKAYRETGGHPFFLLCRYEDPATREVFTFKSGNYMRNLSELEGRQIRVYCDRNDRSKYYVDVESACSLM